jgi:hypothetical protein
MASRILRFIYDLAPPEFNADCRLPIADCRLPIADCRLPIADCRLPIADCRLPSRLPHLSYIHRLRFLKHSSFNDR